MRYLRPFNDGNPPVRIRAFRLALPSALLALGTVLPAAAEVPPGHPTPDAAMRMMQPDAPAAGLRSGTVVSHMDANEYTYIEVNEKGQSVWLAAPRLALKDGDTVRFPGGVTMRDFYSKLLKRTFPAVIFVGGVEVTAAK